MDIWIEKGFINQDTEVFDEYSLIYNYITPYKATEWNPENFDRKSTGGIVGTLSHR